MGILDNPISIPTAAALNGKVPKGDTYINVKDYGAVGDGTTDDTAAIQAAIDAAPPKSVVWFELGKIYALYASLTNSGKSIHLRGVGAKLASKTHAAQIDFTGSWGTVYPVSAIAAGTVTHNSETRAVLNLTVTGTLPYLRGDVVKVYADDVIPGARPGSGGLESRVGQFADVYSSTSGNLAVLVRELLDPMTTNIRVSKLNDITVSLEGLVFDTDEALMNDGGKSNCITFTDIMAPRITNVEIRNSTAQAIQLNSCYAYRVTDVEINDSNDDTPNAQFGYGIIDNSCSHGIIEGLTANFVRHAYSDDSPRIATSSGPSLYGRTFNNTIINGTSFGTSNTSWDTHAASQGIRFINCVAVGSGGPGFGLRGRKHTVSGGMVGSGRDYGVYAFAESGLDTDSWGHTIENVDVEAPLYPILIATQKGTNVRDTRKIFIDNIRVKTPNDLSLWVVNASVNIGRLVFDNVQMSASAASNIKVDNSAVTIETVAVNYKAGLANNNPVGITLVNASNLKINHADIDINGTTNGTRFANYIVSDATSIFRINRMMFTSNVTAVSDFSATHNDSFIDYVTPAGNALGISSAHIPWSSGSPSGPQHALSRSLSPHIVYAGNISSTYTLTSLRSGRFIGQMLTIVNVGAAVLTVNNHATITTLTGAAITLNPKDRAQFYWDSTTWRQLI